MNNKVKKLNVIALLLIGSLFSLTASAALLSLEGVIESVVENGDGSGTMVVMGITVIVPAGTSIISPTAALTMSQLADPTPLPGRAPLAGFIGGTAIILGTALNGVNTADDVFVEPAENIVGGEISHNCITAACDGASDTISISGTVMVAIDDARVPAGAIVNGAGLEIDLMTVAQLSEASAEGYYAADGVFHYFLLSAEGNLINETIDVISIARSRCRDGKELRVRGGVSATTGTVTVVGYGSAPIIEDVLTGQGTYSYRGAINNACPNTITVMYNDATATADVDIR